MELTVPLNTKHLKKVFLDNELEEGSVCAIFAHTAKVNDSTL